jgi:hypothetical protein
MHKLTLFLSVVASLGAGFAGGYYYGAQHVPATAAIEDYALTNVLEDVGYVHYLAKGQFEPMRSLLDVSINTHLSRVRANGGAISDPKFEAARTRTLNAVAVLWERYPPFQSPEWRENDTNAFWWSEWSAGHKKNLALVQEAKAKCAATPSLDCRAQPPASRLPALSK